MVIRSNFRKKGLLSKSPDHRRPCRGFNLHSGSDGLRKSCSEISENSFLSVQQTFRGDDLAGSGEASLQFLKGSPSRYSKVAPASVPGTKQRAFFLNTRIAALCTSAGLPRQVTRKHENGPSRLWLSERKKPRSPSPRLVVRTTSVLPYLYFYGSLP